MTRARAIAVAIGVGVTVGGMPALAGQQVYTYSVVHPSYGKIGTLTNTIDRGPEVMRIDSHLRITLELLGIVFYRQESDITEIMHGERLVSLQSAINKDGQHLEVHGVAQGDWFVVNATAGSFTGPATTAPSDPWVLAHAGEATVVYTDTGRIINMHITGGDYEPVSVKGAPVSAQHFIVMGDKRQEVWLDNRGIPIMFRSFEDGTPIDFVLQNGTAVGGRATVASVKPSALARPKNDSK